MARNASLLGFASIKTEGLLLPPELLARVAALDPKLPGTRAEDYHLPAGERLNEAINRSWNHLTGVWSRFRKEMSAESSGDAATGPTRERWLLPLFQELGYGRLQRQNAVEIEGRSYPISHGWGHAPIHLVGIGLDLDKRMPGQAGAAQASPHSLVQSFLNRTDGHLWAFVSNGLKLRILRDNQSLTRQAFVEFDLAAVMDGELFSDFRLLWLLCHQSRVESERPEQCWLEKWAQEAQQQGVRALDELRRGVTEAISVLGTGFLAHSANADLQSRLASGALSAQDYYRQLLRLVYRLIFLFVAEDRDVLLVRDADATARQRYRDFYSTARLRRLSGRLRGSRHDDLYQVLKLVMDRLHEQGCPPLALPALGSFLWSPESLPDVAGARISNRDLLAAVRELAYTRRNRSLRPIDYRNLGSEELGSVYESLLELHPELHRESAMFLLKTAPGHERKTTGSYYTPDSLVQCLLDSALEPVIADARKGKSGEDAAAALLKLKICDMAVGSGHFLIAAAHRLAKHVAAARTGEEEPGPEAIRAALRDVIGRCLFGVDINPMSVELCKIGLWLEAMEPGKPLTFLDHHIKCGNSLLGATPAAIRAGIPDAAYKPIAGDSKEAANWMKKLNRDAKAGQSDLFDLLDAAPWDRLGNLPAAFARLESLADDTSEELTTKEKLYQELVEGSGYDNARLLHDAWCASFVWPKVEIEPGTDLTTRHLREIESNPHSISPWLRKTIKALAASYQFFHWHLEYPTVFGPDGDGGFDCILGNPPWERVKLLEKEFFAERNPDIASAANAAARKHLISRLVTHNPELTAEFQAAQRQAEGESRFLRDSGYYPLCGRGDINLYAVFAEGMRDRLNSRGRVGCVLPSGIATDDTTKFFFQDLIEKQSLVSLFSFENEEFIFPAVHHATRFCLITMGPESLPTAPSADFVFFARQVEQLRDPARKFSLGPKDIEVLNPNTRTCPVFRSQHDAELNKIIYRRVPVFLREAEPRKNPWDIQFCRVIDMSNDSHLFRTVEQLESEGYQLVGNKFELAEKVYLPLYEGKMLHHFDHRWGTYEGQTEAQANQGKLPEFDEVMHADPNLLAMPRYWVEAREVYLRIANLPKGLLEALRDRDSPLIILGMAYLLFGKWLAAQGLTSACNLMEKMFSAWCGFTDIFPFARPIPPTSIGLCGDNPPCFKPLGPEYLPAESIDQIVSDGRRSTAWYAADANSVSAFLEDIGEFNLEIDFAVTLDNDEDLLNYAEQCLKNAAPRWTVGFRDITGATVLRTVICGILPRVGVGNNLPIILSRIKDAALVGCLNACLSSFICDFAARFKVGGTHLNFFIAQQLPVLSPDIYVQVCPWEKGENNRDWMWPRVLELIFTAWDIEHFARDGRYFGPPFQWNEERRFLLRCELDAAFFHLYGIARDDVDYIMDTFPIVRRKDMAQHGDYRTKRVILEIYDAMQRAMDTGQPYQTLLDPPPADPRVAHPAN